MSIYGVALMLSHIKNQTNFFFKFFLNHDQEDCLSTYIYIYIYVYVVSQNLMQVEDKNHYVLF
jgi:hypothetical protein